MEELNNKIKGKKNIEKVFFASKIIKMITGKFFLVLGIIDIIAGVVCVLVGFLIPKAETLELNFPKIPSSEKSENIYSDLTGEELADVGLKNAPTYCVQTPNGTDGARPQAGLDEAGVVFEAVAERGITRFAAIYQNPKTAVIGPIRSIRLYYLEWDTPFDCTIVHAGGADDALAAIRDNGYKDLTENYAYMYRSNAGNRLWNNLFTTSANLAQFSSDNGQTSSNVNGFSRLTPEESKKSRVDALATKKLVITEATTKNLETLEPKVKNIDFNFGNVPSFNVNYVYNAETNTYDRSYASGVAHNIYSCPKENLGEVSPENSCTLTQLSPSVVVAMIVKERTASDNYHENITTTGTGNAYIFQNGTAIKGMWAKSSVGEQIKFFDENNTEIALAPGQTFISAIPEYGSVEY